MTGGYLNLSGFSGRVLAHKVPTVTVLFVGVP